MGKSTKIPVWVLTIATIVVLILNIYIYAMTAAAGNENSIEFLSYTNIIIVSCASVAAIGFALTMSSFTLHTAPGRVWLFFTLGIVCWLVGDIIWMYNQVIMPLPEELQFPSVADYFWSLGYPLVFIAIAMQLSLAKVKLNSKEILGVLIIIGVSVVISTFTIILPVIESLMGDPTLTVEYWIFSLDYPILDLILLPAAIVLAMKYRGGEFSKAWSVISLGFLLSAIFDLLFTYFENFGEGYLFLYTDHLYIAYYMILGIGGVYLWSSLRKVK